MINNEGNNKAEIIRPGEEIILKFNSGYNKGI